MAGNDAAPEPGATLPTNAPSPRYRPEYLRRAREASSTGYTRTELCRHLGIGLDTLNLWSMVYPEFAAALRENYQARADRVEQAWFQRAVGYEYVGEKIFYDKDDGIVRATCVTHVPADVAAAQNWMKFHRPEIYAAQPESTINVNVNASVTSIRATIEGKLAGIAARGTEVEVPGEPDGGGAG